MAYQGISVPIVLGQAGLITDDPISSLPLNALQKANNITFDSGRIGKSLGSSKYNSSALDSDIVAVFDWFPTPSLQRLIAVTDNGKIWRDTGDTTFGSATPIKTGLGTLTTDTKISAGGAESSLRNKKLFITTGASQVQIIDGDASTTRDINLPSQDWQTGNYPNFCIPYQNRMVMINSAADRHRVYFSTVSDHENFTGISFPTSRWELWSRIAATPNVNLTTNVQAGTAVTIFTTTNNDGFLAYGILPFNRLSLTVSQAATGAPVYTYEYWNGSAWTALSGVSAPTLTATGSTTLSFNIPSNWAVGDGTEGGGNNAYYAIRVLATTAPTTAVQITSLTPANTTYDSAPPTFPVFPGEGEGIISAAVYRGLLFLFKEPYGVYVIDGRDPSSSNWTIQRYTDSFGVASPHSVIQVLGDLLAANSIGSITSLQASDAFGDFEAGDVLANAKVEEYVRDQLNFAGLPYSQSVYYPEKKLAMFTGQSTSTLVRDRILVIDVARQNSRPYFITKDSPNCLALRKDSQGISRPMYGTQDGFVYLMDQQTYSIQGAPYLGEFQTAYTDFSQVDSGLAGKNKIFDFIEVNYLPTGNNDFFCEVYVDGDLRQTLSFSQYLGVGLDEFILDEDSLAADPNSSRNRKPLRSCTGNTISFRFYNNNLNESFRVERIIIGFRLSAEQVYSTQV
jgi:hypothetical protein